MSNKRKDRIWSHFTPARFIQHEAGECKQSMFVLRGYTELCADVPGSHPGPSHTHSSIFIINQGSGVERIGSVMKYVQ